MTKVSPKEEIARLANFILETVPGEPSKDEGAVDCAIRLILAGIAEKQNRVLVEEDERLVLRSNTELEERRARGTGRSRDQMKVAPRNAIFVSEHPINTHYYRKLAESIGRHDLQCLPRNILSNAEFPKLEQMQKTKGRDQFALVVDHAVDTALTDEQRSNLNSLGASVIRYTPPKPPVAEAKPEPFVEWIAEPTPWNKINGNAIELRDLNGRRIGKLKVILPLDDDAQGLRAAMEDVAKQAARLLDHRSNYHTSTIFPSHAVNTSAQPALARMEAEGQKLPNMGSALLGPDKGA